MIREAPVHINGDGQTARDFCYIDNVVQANLLAATVADPAAVNQVYNIALGEKTTLSQLFATLRELLAPHYPHLRDIRPEHRDFRPATCSSRRPISARRCTCSATGRRGGCGRDWRGPSTGTPPRRIVTVDTRFPFSIN